MGDMHVEALALRVRRVAGSDLIPSVLSTAGGKWDKERHRSREWDASQEPQRPHNGQTLRVVSRFRSEIQNGLSRRRRRSGRVGQDQQEVVDTKHGVSRVESGNYFLLIFSRVSDEERWILCSHLSLSNVVERQLFDGRPGVCRVSNSHEGAPQVDWWDRTRGHGLGWVTARDAAGVLVGFVNVAWDGGDHAFLIDTKTRGSVQRRVTRTARR